MKTLQIDQRTESWHAFRKEGIGSSDISILMGNDSKKTPFMLWQEKCLGFEGTTFVSWQMQNGIDQEPKALAKLQKQEDPNISPVCAMHDNLPFIRCSFDGFSENAIYEIKTPGSDKTFEEYLFGEIPEKWKDQVRWQMLVSGVRKGYLVLWTGEDYVLKKVDWSEEWENTAIHLATKFWDNVDSYSPPDLTSKDINFVNVPKEKKSEYLELLNLKDMQKGLSGIEKRKKELMATLLDGLEQRTTQLGDLRFTFVPKTSTIDYKAVFESIESELQKGGISVNLKDFEKPRASYWRV